MRKFALTGSIAAASLMVTGCGTTKDAGTSANAAEAIAPVSTDAMAPVADANSANGNAADAKMAASTETANEVEDDDKGGDPADRK